MAAACQDYAFVSCLSLVFVAGLLCAVCAWSGAVCCLVRCILCLVSLYLRAISLFLPVVCVCCLYHACVYLCVVLDHVYLHCCDLACVFTALSVLVAFIWSNICVVLSMVYTVYSDSHSRHTSRLETLLSHCTLCHLLTVSIAVASSTHMHLPYPSLTS